MMAIVKYESSVLVTYISTSATWLTGSKISMLIYGRSMPIPSGTQCILFECAQIPMAQCVAPLSGEIQVCYAETTQAPIMYSVDHIHMLILLRGSRLAILQLLRCAPR